jgi:topoisomerase IA-like protein
LIADLEVVDDNNVIVAWSGRTYSFRARFDLLDIPLQDSMRILNEDQRNVGEARTAELIESTFGEAVLRDAVVNVRMDGEPRLGTFVHTFVQTLLAKPNLFFDSF